MDRTSGYYGNAFGSLSSRPCPVAWRLSPIPAFLRNTKPKSQSTIPQTRSPAVPPPSDCFTYISLNIVGTSHSCGCALPVQAQLGHLDTHIRRLTTGFAGPCIPTVFPLQHAFLRINHTVLRVKLLQIGYVSVFLESVRQWTSLVESKMSKGSVYRRVA